MPTPKKEALVEELRQATTNSETIYLTEFRHLNVAEMSELRGRVLEHEAYLRVTKNRLLKLAFAETNAEGLSEYLTGPTAVTFCSGEPIAVAKVLTNFGQDHQHLSIKAGLFEGQILGRQQVAQIARLPARDQLLAMVLAGLSGPASSLIRLLNAVTSQVVFTLDAVANKRKEEA